MPIPTRYAAEECRVDGVSCAADVVGQSLRASLHDKGLFYERKYEVDRDAPRYESKLGFASPAQSALGRIAPGSVVLDLGSSDGHLAGALRAKGCTVIGVDLAEPEHTDRFDEFIRWNLDHGPPPCRERRRCRSPRRRPRCVGRVHCARCRPLPRRWPRGRGPAA